MRLGLDAEVAVGALGPHGDVGDERGRHDGGQRRPHPGPPQQARHEVVVILRVPHLAAASPGPCDAEHAVRRGRPRGGEYAVVRDGHQPSAPARQQQQCGRRRSEEQQAAASHGASVLEGADRSCRRERAVRVRTLLAVPLLLAAAALPVAADVVHLRGGRRIVGRVIDDGDPVRLEMAGGTLSLPRSRVARIERAELPSAALERQSAELREGDAAGALALAARAHEAALPRAEGRLLERAAAWAPDDAAVREALWRWRVLERPLAPDAAATERLRRLVGDDARVHRSAHWRIAHDCETAIARERAAALEDVWREFHDLMRDIGVRPAPLDRRLEALLFADHADWVAAAAAPADALRGLNGLFVGATGRILLFDTRTAPAAGTARAALTEAVTKLAEKAVYLDQREGQLRAIRLRVEEYRPTPADRDGARLRGEKLAEIDGLLAEVAAQRRTLALEDRELDAHRARVRRFWDEETVAATMHEACHQIAFATGVSDPAQPLWLSEGLATLFEAPQRSALDPMAKTSARLRDVRALRDAQRGGDLRRLVGGAVFAQKPTGDAYAEAWSLLNFLVLRHPEGLAAVIRERGRGGSGDPAQRALDAFRDAFGDLDRIEREWRRFVEHL